MGKGKRKPLRGGQDSLKSARTGDDGESKEELRNREAEREDDSDSESSDGDIALEGNTGEEPLSMTFEFNDMKEDYSYGIAKMLSFLISVPRDAQEAAELIASQEEVGTAILCEEGEDVFGYATVLPLPSIQSSSIHLRAITESLLSSLDSLGANSEGVAAMRTALTTAAAQTGVLLHGRFVNLPLELVPHLHRNLAEDIAWAQSEESQVEGAGASPFCDVSMCLLLAPVSVSGGQPSPKKGQCMNVTGSSSAVMCSHFEDEVFFDESRCSLLFRAPHGAPESLCVAALVPMTTVTSKCLTKITELVP